MFFHSTQLYVDQVQLQLLQQVFEVTGNARQTLPQASIVLILSDVCCLQIDGSAPFVAKKNTIWFVKAGADIVYSVPEDVEGGTTAKDNIRCFVATS